MITSGSQKLGHSQNGSCERAFLILLGLYCINQVFSSSQLGSYAYIDAVLKIGRWGILAVILLIIIKSSARISHRLILVIASVASFALINAIVSDGGVAVIAILLFGVASSNISIKRIYQVTVFSLMLATIIVLFLAWFGMLSDAASYRFIGNYFGSILSGSYLRHSMGFLVHNQIPFLLMQIYCLLIACYKNKLKWYIHFFVLLLNGVCLICFGSRTIFLLVFGLAFGSAILWNLQSLNRRKPHGTALAFAASFIFPICAGASLFAAFYFDPSSAAYSYLDTWLNNRIHLAQDAINHYGLGIIGSGKYAGTYNSVSLSNNTVDNGYVLLFVQQGIIVASLILFIWSYLAYTSAEKHDWYLLLALIALAVANIVDSHLVAYALIPFFCLFFQDFEANQREAKKNSTIQAAAKGGITR